MKKAWSVFSYYLSLEYRNSNNNLKQNKMKATESNIKKVKDVINSNYFVKDRIVALNSLGLCVEDKPMGSGGVGQVKNMKESVRIQIGWAWGRYNYAPAVELEK